MKKQLCLLLLLLPFGALFSQTDNTFLWRITNPANDSNSYLFGTIHLPQEKFMRLPDSVYSAVNQTAVFYNEINFAGMANETEEIMAFSTKRLREMDSIRQTPSWRRLVAAVNEHYHQKINPDSMEQFNSFGIKLLQEWYAPEPGVPPLDMALMALAMGLGKPTKGLERAVFQIQMMHQLLDLRLADTTLLFDADLAMTRDLARQYEHKALDSVGVLVNNINPLYRRVVFDGRNRTMADSIAKVIKNNTAFFAIGAGHLTGPDGLIALLRNKGFLVRPVFSDNAVSVTLMGQIFQTMARNMRLELKKKDDDFVAPPPPPSFNPPGVKIKLAPKAKATRKTKKS